MLPEGHRLVVDIKENWMTLSLTICHFFIKANQLLATPNQPGCQGRYSYNLLSLSVTSYNPGSEGLFFQVLFDAACPKKYHVIALMCPFF